MYLKFIYLKSEPHLTGDNELTIIVKTILADNDSMTLYMYVFTVSKIRKNIYRSDIQITFELYAHFRCLHVFIPNKSTYCLTPWISKLTRSFEIHGARQYLINFTDLAGTVNVTVSKTKANCPYF